MSVSGMWVVAAIKEKRIAEIAESFQQIVAGHRARPENQAAWQAWCEGADLVPGYFPSPQPGIPNMVSPLPSVAAFNALASDMPWHDGAEGSLDLFSADVYDAIVEPLVVSVRKGSPVAALFHGIGPERAQLLPGWMGNFLLTAAEVREVAPNVEQALSIPADQEVQVIQRIRDWLNGMGDSGDEAAELLLRGPLRCWRAAIEAGAGLCGAQSWI
jgi:hypothetical protein